MKIIKRILMIFVMMFVPTVVFAAGSVSPNTTSLTIEQGSSASFTVTATNAAGRIDVTSNNSSIASLTSSSSAFVDNNSATFTLNGVSAGSTTVKLALTDVATYDNEVLDNVYTINVTVNAPKSSNANLSSLTINGAIISGFSASKTSYSYEGDVTSINVGGSVEDTGKAQIISGTGNHSLDYNAKTITVTVRAQNGSTKNYTISAKRTDNRSSDNYLSNLTTNPSLFSFNRNTTSYTQTVENNVSSISITATPNDSKSSVSINGTRGTTRTVNLNNYRNTINIVVTSEKGETRTYRLVITRKDEEGRTSAPDAPAANDSTLSNLTITGTEVYSIPFNPDVLEYKLDVPMEVEKVTIAATPTNASATIEGVGEVALNPGENIYTIKVNIPNGDPTEYKITINRIDSSSVPSTRLNSLIINGKEINVNTDENTFLVGFDSTVTELDLQYKTSSKTSKFHFEGDKRLSSGINVIKITVTDDGEEDNTYTIIIHKATGTIVDNLAIDEFTGETTYQTRNQVKLKKSLLEQLAKTNHKFNYNFVNEYDGLLYSIQFDKNVSIDEDIELSLNKIGNYEKSVVYASNIPKGANIRLHVDEKLKDKTVYLYSYNMETKKYILIKSNEKIENEYINFESDGSYIYFISEKKITDHNFVLQIVLYVLFFALGAIIMLTVFVFLKKRKLKKESI